MVISWARLLFIAMIDVKSNKLIFPFILFLNCRLSFIKYYSTMKEKGDPPTQPGGLCLMSPDIVWKHHGWVFITKNNGKVRKQRIYHVIFVLNVKTKNGYTCK